MTARGGQNLLKGAVRIHASGRPYGARLDAFLSFLVRTLPLSSATIYLPDERRRVLSRRFTSSAPYRKTGCNIPFDEGCSGRCAAALAPQSAGKADLHADEPCGEGDSHFLALPIRLGGELLAVLSVGATSPLPATLKKAIGPVVPLIASLARGVRREEEDQERQRHLSLIAELSRLQCIPLAPGKYLPNLLRLCNSRGLSRCAFVRLTGGPERARLFKSCSVQMRPHLPAILESEAQLSAAALAQGSPVTEEVLESASAPSLCLPLQIGDRALGTLTLWGEPTVHETQQRELAETVSRLVSCAMAEAINSQRIASFYSSNEKKLKELSLLYRMSNTMLSTIKLNKLIHLTLTALTSGPTPFFDRAMLFLVNERSGVLQGMLGVTTETAPSLASQGSEDILSSRWDISEEVMASQQESDFSKEVRGMRLELNKTLNAASRAVLEKKLIYVGDSAESTTATSYAVAPLLAHDKVVGAVSVDNALTGTTITQEDLRFLQLFTNQAGMAIENSILYNRLEDANRQLCETQEHLLQRERLAAIGEMAAGIAHELKNPLVAIGGFAGRLTRKLAKDSGAWGDADLIVREVMRLEAILSEILFFSKKSGTAYVRCNLKQIIRESLQVITPGLMDRKITVSTRFCRHPLHLQGDPQQLKQVFINILGNAQDAMAGGGQLKLAVTVTEVDGSEGVSVKISDTGGGIPVEALHSIFTPFYTTKEKGTGLGLPIANRIIINHGGKIQVHNKPGVGADFTVLLPLQQ
ncbi:ATP-binding protein [Geomonas sp. RF6]|uniref:ATP-binding protein n=1 Tax=Geomonas sp. RF6 TaxID=2897342 RepID=UPI001E5693C9|nr:ATP-binding protein [Geomonas sp. RF6]UFS72235.1 ATP-binding protein [Geomonas sp. RF6]